MSECRMCRNPAECESVTKDRDDWKANYEAQTRRLKEVQVQRDAEMMLRLSHARVLDCYMVEVTRLKKLCGEST